MPAPTRPIPLPSTPPPSLTHTPFTRRRRRPPQNILRAFLAIILFIHAAAPQGPHPTLRRPPRLQLQRIRPLPSATTQPRRIPPSRLSDPAGASISSSSSAAVVARPVGKVRDEGRERGDARDDDADGGFDNGPFDCRGGVEVVCQVADGLDADDLDDCHEEAEGEEAEEGDFAARLHLELEEDGKGEDEPRRN
ncbi:hypothetical protein CCMA1212_000242 [Trichoderma ghanense]|uniref:Uncharacterized protein n=1 Tax=Trichoderma ghanense TaxID=65468 RepID=A0ABY2HK59_9HYPO